MKALVTAGGGFLGGAIVRMLLDRGGQVRSLAPKWPSPLSSIHPETARVMTRDPCRST